MITKEAFYKFLAASEPDKLAYPFDVLIDIVSPEQLYRITEELGGTTVYFPRPRTMFKEAMNNQIKKEFDGYNYSKLAVKYDLSERTVRTIVNNDKK